MPLFVAVGAIVTFFTRNWNHFLISLGIEVFMLWFLWYSMRKFFKGVEINEEQVLRHISAYDLKDPDADDSKMKESRLKDYKNLALNYYNLTTQIFHKIWGPHYSMGIEFPTESGTGWMSYPQCQSVYQCYLAQALKADENSVIGDFGCGTGGPTRCIAQFTGAKIKAVNINEGHLKQMKKWNEDAHIDHRIELVQADYHATPLAANSLDGVYMCESAACTYDHRVLFKEVFRVLKPGARFTGFDWQMTDKFDEKNAEHRRIRHLLELGVGVPRLVNFQYTRDALKEAGFEVVTVRNHSDWAEKLGGKPWDALFDQYKTKFWMTSLVRVVLVIASTLRILSPLTVDCLDIMVACREGMVQGGAKELDIFTPMAFWLAIKPAK